ncbi:unnamed protein product [Colias eurytheme]|nr:unnamed protein product [Colias eurytheme]
MSLDALGAHVSGGNASGAHAAGGNATAPLWEVAPMVLDVFYRPDVPLIVLYVLVLTASLLANTLLIFIVIKFQYMRR